jgi:hypothetical protein
MKTFMLRLYQSLFATIMSIAAVAQDGGGKKVDVDINVGKDKTDWYQQPWVWIVGGAIFILLLVALLRGSGSKSAE